MMDPLIGTQGWYGRLPADDRSARIGLIIPSSNRNVERELVPICPASVSPHIARVRLRGLPQAELLPAISEAARSLGDAFCDPIVFNCTASSMETTPEANGEIIRTIESAASCSAMTTGSALLDAVATLAVTGRALRIGLLTPYSAAVTARQEAFLTACGIEVVSSRALDLNRFPDYAYLPSVFWHQELHMFERDGCDAILLSCANIRVLDIVERAEGELGIPLLTSNQAVLWSSLRRAGFNAPIEGIGALGSRQALQPAGPAGRAHVGPQGTSGQ